MTIELASQYESYAEVFRRSLMSSGKSDTTIAFYKMKAKTYLKCVQDEGYNPFTSLLIILIILNTELLQSHIQKPLILMRSENNGSATLNDLLQHTPNNIG
jgi:hypothetical protein